MSSPSRLTHVEVQSPIQTNLLENTYSLEQFVDLFKRPCSQFITPFSLKEKLQLAFATFAAQLPIFKTIEVLPLHTVPPNWQVLLNYLYQQGIIRAPHFAIRTHSNDLPKRNKAALRPRFDPSKSDGQDISDAATGYAMSADQEEAYSKAIGEFLERYFLSLYKKKNFIKASINSLTRQGHSVLNLKELNGFLPWQQAMFPKLRWDADSIFPWIKIKQVFSGIETFVPAQLVYWGYRWETEPPEPILVHSTTNAAAGHFTYLQALLAGLYEAIQRDAFMIFWLNSLSPDIIEMDDIPAGEAKKLIAEIKLCGLQAFFLDITTDIEIPSCVCLLVDERSDEPLISMGAATSFDIENAVLSSAYEAISVHNATANERDHATLPEDYVPFTSHTIDRDERIKLWRGKEMLKHLKFLTSGKRVPLTKSRFYTLQRTFKSIEEERDYVFELFKKRGTGYEIYSHEVKHPVLERIGYHVVKVLVPRLMPLYLVENLATLDSVRVREVPAKLGYTETTLNPWPHPFP